MRVFYGTFYRIHDVTELEKLPAHLLATTAAISQLPRMSEGRAEELADLLIKAAQEVNRVRS